MMFPHLAGSGIEHSERLALRFPDSSWTYAELSGAVAAAAASLQGLHRVGVWAESTAHTAVAALGALVAGVALVPLNPRSGERELAHVLQDSAPERILAEDGATLPPAAGYFPRAAAPRAGSSPLPAEPDPETPALILYTSGTTGAPKGAVLPRRALQATIDGLSQAWQWGARDVVVHGLPLFHAHGLVLGTLGPLRLGGTSWHLGRFEAAAAARALGEAGTMLFGVPTTYSRLIEAVEADPELAAATGQARLLVSGSAALPATLHRRMAEATGQQIVERYGMSETMFNTSTRADGRRVPGTVGTPLPGVALRLVDDAGRVIEARDDTTIGEIEVRGDNLFLGYLGRPEETAADHRDGWFVTGDMAVRTADGDIRIVGRRSVDLISSGGHRIGAGEIENALLEHPQVAEVAVTGEPDADLGERVVAWVVPAGQAPSEEALVEHVSGMLASHKRPRAVRFVAELPRNDIGKVVKKALGER
jgi:malonyl-CoA/methylmalonyl-CoA synthetase